MTYLPGVVFLLLTIGDIERGETDLLAMFSRGHFSISRSESRFFFWCAVMVELSISAGLLWIGRYIEVAMS